MIRKIILMFIITFLISSLGMFVEEIIRRYRVKKLDSKNEIVR